MTFQAGMSGKPGGRPKGSRNRPKPDLPALLREVAARDGVAILDALLKATRAGDPAAAAVLLQACQGQDRP